MVQNRQILKYATALFLVLFETTCTVQLLDSAVWNYKFGIYLQKLQCIIKSESKYNCLIVLKSPKVSLPSKEINCMQKQSNTAVCFGSDREPKWYWGMSVGFVTCQFTVPALVSTVLLRVLQMFSMRTQCLKENTQPCQVEHTMYSSFHIAVKLGQSDWFSSNALLVHIRLLLITLSCLSFTHVHTCTELAHVQLIKSLFMTSLVIILVSLRPALFWTWHIIIEDWNLKHSCLDFH